MSWKIIAGLVLVILLILGVGGYVDYKLSFAAGSKSRDALCTQERAADKSTYQQAQTDAVSKAAKAQSDADKQQMDDLRQQLAAAQQQSLIAQQKADAAKSTADNLNATLARLKNENKDVGNWNDACLPNALLASLHPGASGKAPAGACR
jgi:Tfp pilus assembly protein PilO